MKCDVEQGNVFKASGVVMGILTAKMEVMKLIAVSNRPQFLIKGKLLILCSAEKLNLLFSREAEFEHTFLF